MQYQIGPWLFSPARCIISSSGIERELDPLTFKLINYFITQPDRIIARQELVDNVWQQNFVDDNAINRAISELRKQLNHHEHKAPLIKTHYRKGYSLTVTPEKVNNIPEPSTIKQQVEFVDDSGKVDVRVEQKVPSFVAEEVGANSSTPLIDTLNTAQVNSESTVATLPLKKSFKKISSYKWLLILVILLLFINIVIDFKQLSENESSNIPTSSTKQSEMPASGLTKTVLAQEVSITTATWNIGSETYPLLSPDKAFFAYTNKHNGISSTHVKNLSSQQEIKLNYNGLHISAKSWQPKSRNLLTEVTDRKSECYYASFDLKDVNNIPKPRLIKKCDKQILGTAQLSLSGDTMFYFERDEKGLGNEIHQFEIQTKKSHVLVPSGNAQYGVISMLLSPNGEKLVYQWYERNSPIKTYLLDLVTREQRILQEQAEEFSDVSLAWLPNGTHIGALKENILELINVENNQRSSIKIPFQKSLGKIEFIDKNQLLSSESGSINYQIAQIEHLFSDSPAVVNIVQASDSNNYRPSSSKKQPSLHYLVSRRTNTNQIWLANGDKEKQISNFDSEGYNAIYTLVLSHNEDYLLFTRNNKLEFIDLNSGVLHKIPELDTAKATSYLWTNNDKSIIYSSIKNNVSQIWQFDLLTKKNKQLTFAGGQKLLKNDQGKIFYINDNQLLNLGYEQDENNPDNVKVTINIPVAYCWCSIVLKGDYLYSLGDPLTLSRMHLYSLTKQDALLPIGVIDISFIPGSNTLLTTVRKERNTQIQRIFWSETHLP